METRLILIKLLSLNKYLKTGKLLFVVYLFLLKDVIVGQNLICNPSFERTDTPVYWNSGTFINNSVFPALRNVSCWDWFNSPDYFSTNVPYTGVFRGIPLNDFGFAYPVHGSAYGGISVVQGNVSDYKEYVCQQLTTPLIADSNYCLSFYVSLADRVQIAIKNIGALFSIGTPSLVTNYYINATPQVVNNNGFMTDTIGWTEIQGCFTALGGEQYITIGSFGNRASTDTINTVSANPLTGPGSSFSYYYIDSVSLWKNNFPTFIKEDPKDELVSVYPNPAKDVLNFNVASVTERKKLKVEVTDVIGREILVSEYKEQLNISHLEKGIYFLRMYEGNQIILIKKIIKE